MKTVIFLQYRGIETERLAESILYIGCLIEPLLTLRKLKTLMPSLKSRTALCSQSNVIYQYECASCHEAYIGYTTRHLGVRIDEHAKKSKSKAIWRHHQSCNGTFDKRNFNCLYKTNKSKIFLEIVEALFIRYKKPKINDKDEFRARQLRLKLF